MPSFDPYLKQHPDINPAIKNLAEKIELSSDGQRHMCLHTGAVLQVGD